MVDIVHQDEMKMMKDDILNKLNEHFSKVHIENERVMRRQNEIMDTVSSLTNDINSKIEQTRQEVKSIEDKLQDRILSLTQQL